MRAAINYRSLVAFSLIGCVSTRQAPTSLPAPSPSAPALISGVPSSWTITILPGTAAYRVTRSATIDNLSDSAHQREISINTTYESITVHPAGDTINFSAAVDTFSTTTQGSIGSAQQAQLPLQLTGVLVKDSLIISTDSLTGKCSPVASALTTDLRNLLLRFPDTLSPASRWRDSTSTTGCQAAIPTTSKIMHDFKVLGMSAYEGFPVLVVQRSDTISAEGDGTQQQHRLLLNATGTGSATYYLDTSTGRVLHLTANQDLDLTITTSGKNKRFRQSAKQDFALVR